MTDTIILDDGLAEPEGARFSWGLAIAGGVAATAVTFFLLTLGAGFGLLLVNPVTEEGPSLPTFLTLGAIYFLAAQAFGFAVGGHLAGRLMGPLVEPDREENVRAGAHGLVAWAVAVLATLTMVALTGMAATHTGATTAALYGAASQDEADGEGMNAYFIDKLFRPGPATPAASPAPAGTGMGPVPAGAPMSVAATTAEREEAARILGAGFVNGIAIPEDDRPRLIELTARQAGISEGAAVTRIDTLQAETQAAAKQAADIARQAASYTSLWIAVALLFGAIVSIASAVYARFEKDGFPVARRTVVAV
jgi:hypothetical protein